MSKRRPSQKIKNQRKRGQGDSQQKKVLPLPGPFLQLLPILFLIAATLFLFWSVRNYEFINLDDDVYVYDNPQVKAGLTLKGVIWAFTTMHMGNWHPLTWLSHMLDFELYGLNPGAHHLTSLLFHIANTLLLFWVLKRMTGRLWASSFVAALFALHPLHVESVAWVAERKDVLSTFFWMLTLWTYIRYVERPGLNRYLLTILFFALGLLSKPMLVTLPFVLLLLDYWPLGRFSFGRSGVHPGSKRTQPLAVDQCVSVWPGCRPTGALSKVPRALPVGFHSPNAQRSPDRDRESTPLHLVLEKVPFFVLSAISSLLTFFAQRSGGAVTSLRASPMEARLANAIVSYAHYIEKMIWPRNLAVFYPYPDMIPMGQVAVAGILLFGISVFVIRWARTRPYLVVGWLWYLGTLVPVIGLVRVGLQAMADRYTYVPLIGLFIMVAMGVPDTLKEWRHRKIALIVSAGLVLSFFITVARLQVYQWQTSMTLFKHTVTVTAKNFIFHNNLGSLLAKQGKIEEAAAHYNEALRIKPNYAEAHNNLGSLLAKQGKIEEAAAHYTQALRIKPDYADAHCNLGNVLAKQGKVEEAVAHYTQALRIKPNFAEAHYNLGILLAQQGRQKEAMDHFSQGLGIEVPGNLGIGQRRKD